ncbi:hypothetical protein CC2G_002418 [Coprinopsis cinerea AmutBmut pab1-1]|nr:hypothetical protein CC2G_002418 [Coprinopsis cinerea AmutBmut pab1-1]
MILDDKTIMALPPPPPYLPSNNPFSHPTPGAQSPANPPPSFSEALNSPTCSHTPGRALKLSSLPPHILLQVVYNTFPTHPLIDTLLVERQRKTLLWLAKSLRLVNKAFYIACMHVLRSTYLPAYTSLLRPYYSSDPFPSTPVPQAHGSTLNTVQRETPILDQFIALKVREDVFADDSELHLEREDMFKDIFDHSQPKARLEDLVRIYGVKEGVVTLAPPGVVTYTSTSTSSSSSKDTVMPARPNMPPPSPGGSTGRSSTSRFFSAFMRSSSSRSKSKSPSPPPTARQSATTKRKIRPVPFALLSVTFSTRKVGLQLMSTETGAKRTIVEVQRMSRDENLEAAASRIVAELKGLLLS